MKIKKNNFKIFLFIFFLNLKLVKPLEGLFDKVENLHDFDQNNQNQFEYNKVSIGPCNIPVVTSPITQNEFLEKYAYSSPVIFRRDSDEIERNKIFTERCQLANLIKDYGEKFVTVSTANTYSYKKYSMKLSSYLKEHVLPFENINEKNLPKIRYGNETWYFFGENNFEWKSLLDLYDRPKYNLPNHEHAYSFGIAGSLTGVPFHFHGIFSR